MSRHNQFDQSIVISQVPSNALIKSKIYQDKRQNSQTSGNGHQDSTHTSQPENHLDQQQHQMGAIMDSLNLDPLNRQSTPNRLTQQDNLKVSLPQIGRARRLTSNSRTSSMRQSKKKRRRRSQMSSSSVIKHRRVPGRKVVNHSMFVMRSKSEEVTSQRTRIRNLNLVNKYQKKMFGLVKDLRYLTGKAEGNEFKSDQELRSSLKDSVDEL